MTQPQWQYGLRQRSCGREMFMNLQHLSILVCAEALLHYAGFAQSLWSVPSPQ